MHFSASFASVSSRSFQSHQARLLGTVLFHALFSAFGDLLANVLNYLSVPVRAFLTASLRRRYGIQPESSEFELFYSGIATSFFIGSILAGLVMAQCMERYGRKGTAVYIRSSLGVLSALCMLAAAWLDSPELFICGHALAGALATLKTVLYIYMAECAPDQSRGWSTTAIGSGSSLALLAVSPLCLPALFGNSARWWLLPALALVLAMAHLFGAAQWPESPKHLYIGMADWHNAKHSVAFYHGSDANLEAIFDEFEQERHVVHHQRSRVDWTEFWTSRRLRCSLALILLASAVPALSLVNLKSQYMEPMLQRYGLDQAGAMAYTMVITAFTAPLCLLAPCMVERWGRRPLFLAITALSTLELVMVMLAQGLFDFLGGGAWPVSAIALFGCAAGQAGTNLGIFNMTPMLAGELLPHPARARATQLALMLPSAVVIGTVLAYPSLIGPLGFGFFVPPALASALVLWALFRWLPETRGLPVDQIFRRLADSSRASSVAHYGAIGENNGDLLPLMMGKV